MTIDEIVEHVRSLDGVVVQRPAPGDGSPEISWGDVFVFHAPDGVPHGQPFATVVTKAYPDEPDVGAFDLPGAFRLNIGLGRTAAAALLEAEPAAGPADVDAWHAHPVYGSLGWVAVVQPAERTSTRALALLDEAHAAAVARHERRHDVGDGR